MLVGREAERATLDSVLDRVRRGGSGALVLRGEAGVGKTALLQYAVARGEGLWVLRAAGVESESELPYSGLHELVRPLLPRIGEIPERQGAALAGVLELGPPVAVSRFSVGAAVLSILAVASEERPIACIVDDAHWLDDESAGALVFAARRLRAEAVAMLFASREGATRRLDAPGLPDLILGGLPAADAGRLLERDHGGIDAAVRERLVALAAGNPLALVELPTLLDEARLAGREPLPDPFTLSGALERAFLARVERLSAGARAALVVIAAAGTRSLAIVVPALDGLGVPSQALEEAEAAGLVELRPGEVVLRHPLVGSAVYGAAGPEERRRVHAALARVLEGPGAWERRSWHLAAAASGPDAAVADELEEGARRVEARSLTAAAGLWERAARLSTATPARARRLYAAGLAARKGGRESAACLALLDEALEDADEPLLRADIQLERGMLLMHSRGGTAAHALLVGEAERLLPVDRERASLMLRAAASLVQHDVQLFSATSRRALETAPAGGIAELHACLAYGLALSWEGRRSESLGALGRAEELLRAHTECWEDVEVLLGAGWVLTRCELPEQVGLAREVLSAALERARRQGALTPLLRVLRHLSDVEWVEGSWDASYATLAEASVEPDRHAPSFYLHNILDLAWRAAMLGRDDDVRGHVLKVERIAGRSSGSAVAALRALAALGGGRADEAAASFDEVGEGPGLGWQPPWVTSAVEAYMRTGRLEEARSLLRRLEEAAARGEDPASRVAAAWARAVAGPADAFEASFAEALDLHATWAGPYHPDVPARIHLAWGARLRRAGRRLDARGHLREALAGFERLGAAGFAERAREELRASGERLRRGPSADLGALTPQELQVALTIAAGASYKDAAARLFLSPKTIEFHLNKVYRKLGISSRTELPARLAPAPGDAPERASAGGA